MSGQTQCAFVTPAEAGGQSFFISAPDGAPLDSGFRRNDGEGKEADHG